MPTAISSLTDCRAALSGRGAAVALRLLLKAGASLGFNFSPIQANVNDRVRPPRLTPEPASEKSTLPEF